MLIVIIIVFAVLILAFFSYRGRNLPVIESTLKDETGEETLISATVKSKAVTENGTKRQHYLMYLVEFSCDDGEVREFNLPEEVFKAVKVGVQDTLICSDNLFIGFGDYGAVSDDIDAEIDEALGENGFSYDDFDESMDIELVSEFAGENKLTTEDKAFFAQFRERKKLPMKLENLQAETDDLSTYPTADLLQSTTIYPFLAWESDVRKLFREAYSAAYEDMLGFDGNARKGKAADSIIINKNEVRVAVIVEQKPKPLASLISVEYGINE